MHNPSKASVSSLRHPTSSSSPAASPGGKKEKAVCDSSVLITFAKAGKLDWLLGAFDKPLRIPPAVYSEVVERGIEKKEPDAFVVKGSVEKGFVSVSKNRKAVGLPFLGAGESAVIQLAIESGVKTVCFDEAPARNAAKQSGLKPIGTLGVLLLSLKNGSVSRKQLLSALDEMIRRDFRINAKLLEAFKNAVNGS